MKLTAYVIDGHKLKIRPAPVEREWMDATNEKFAYRCLPLNIANGYGWEILCPSAFIAIWSGAVGLDAIRIQPSENTKAPVTSHFGHGVLTFHVPCLFRTEPGFDLMVQGPINRPRHAIAPLSGIIETDWVPFTFTMNWVFTRPSIIKFAQDEPFCHIFPVRRGELESVEPQIRNLSEDPELKSQYQAWQTSRSQFNADLKRPESQARSERWQKQYYRGLDAEGRLRSGEDHRTRLRLRPFQIS
jgi:hypothetical protein